MATKGEHCIWLRNCEQETSEEIPGTVRGTIPQWLEGRLTRNGPGKLEVGDTQYRHLFDSLAMLHQFSISAGRVTYRSRFLDSDTYRKNTAANRIVVTEFGTAAYPDPCKTLYGRFKSMFTSPEKKISDNCLVSVCQVTDEMYAMTETSIVRKIDPKTLETVGKVKIHDYIALNLATAHPHIESDGTVYNMGSSFVSVKGPSYNIVEMPMGKIEGAKIVASVTPLRRTSPSYFHSFAITENYFVLVEQPLVFRFGKVLSGVFMNKAPADSLTWLPHEKTVFRVVKRSTGQLLPIHYTSDAFATFHHTNAYEEDGNLVMDLCGTEDGEIVKMLFIANLQKDTSDETRVIYGSTMRRYVMPLNGVDKAAVGENLVKIKDTTCKAIKQANGSVHCTTQIIHPDFLDMPRINYKKNGKKYRYTYAVGTKGNDLQFERILKLDVKTGKMTEFTENEFAVAEPVFVEAPDATEEDDGVVLSTLLSKSDPLYVALLVLDAKDMKEMARVEFRARGKVTSTFHGQYVGAQEGIHAF
ncbi:beta,beta-carotene 15,15'-dioxygenase-like [Macrobrachium rosenbergii]|uniref:beta,beta-carotene 15,15'-dioxygenase-like n=1 Tax=Macrobrachium rosenbergii TaxID=79674 RepID=UPI0034D55B50